MSEKALRRATQNLVRVILDDPKIPGNPVLLSGLSGSPRQAFRNGYYSIRDTAEFKDLLALMKHEGMGSET